jgi:hypothetical protein
MNTRARALIIGFLCCLASQAAYAQYGGRTTNTQTYANRGPIAKTTLILKGDDAGHAIAVTADDVMTNPAFVVLTDGATVTWTASTNNIVQQNTVTLGGNRTLAMSGWTAGMRGILIVKQDGTGSRTLTLPAGSKVTGGGAGAVTLTATASAIDKLSVTYDGTNYFWDYGTNYN